MVHASAHGDGGECACDVRPPSPAAKGAKRSRILTYTLVHTPSNANTHVYSLTRMHTLTHTHITHIPKALENFAYAGMEARRERLKS